MFFRDAGRCHARRGILFVPTPDALRRAFFGDRVEPRRPPDVGQGRLRWPVAFLSHGQRPRKVPGRHHDLRGQTFLPPFRGGSAGAGACRAAEPCGRADHERGEYAHHADHPPEPRRETPHVPGKVRRDGARHAPRTALQQGSEATWSGWKVPRGTISAAVRHSFRGPNASCSPCCPTPLR